MRLRVPSIEAWLRSNQAERCARARFLSPRLVALCPPPSALCSPPSALCPLPSALCPRPPALFRATPGFPPREHESRGRQAPAQRQSIKVHATRSPAGSPDRASETRSRTECSPTPRRLGECPPPRLAAGREGARAPAACRL